MLLLMKERGKKGKQGKGGRGKEREERGTDREERGTDREGRKGKGKREGVGLDRIGESRGEEKKEGRGIYENECYIQI